MLLTVYTFWVSNRNSVISYLRQYTYFASSTFLIIFRSFVLLLKQSAIPLEMFNNHTDVLILP